MANDCQNFKNSNRLSLVGKLKVKPDMKLSDIAKLAGVDESSVSRVLNGKSRVCEEKREKILQIVKETGYRPNAAGRSLRSAKTNSIGVCFYDKDYISDSTFANFVNGVLEVTNTRRHSLMITTTQVDRDNFNIMNAVQEKRIDGAIIYDDLIDDNSLQQLADLKFPFILINRRSPVLPATPMIFVDYRKGTEKAVNHLIKLGHGRIGIAVAHKVWYVYNEKISGYKDALDKAGIPFDENLIAYKETDQSIEIQKCLDTVLNQKDPATAMIFHTDENASFAMHILHESGLRVPEDFSIIGYNDVTEEIFTKPALTTVRTFSKGIGRQAARILLNMISDKDPVPNEIMLPTKLIVRDSTGKRKLK
ncbi:MAG: LacI family transcriptional regulator [Patescibacteria group bacterium]|nr:LacI family transcriptional regulator [Patescibacteria group bacterium]